MKYLLFTFLLAAGFMMTSCGGDSVDCMDVAAINQDLADETDAVNDALEAYVTSPTDENCNDYKDAINDFIDELQKFRECVPAEDLADWDESISDAEDTLAGVVCQ